jgi:hypothetical protein
MIPSSDHDFGLLGNSAQKCKYVVFSNIFSEVVH